MLDFPAALKVPDGEPANDGPEEPHGPPRQDIAGIMNAQVNSAHSDEKGEKDGAAEHVNLEWPCGGQPRLSQSQ